MKKSFVAKLSAVALALMLSLGFDTSVFAATGDGVTEAAITKNLQMDENVTTPNVTFTFDVEKVSLDGSNDLTALAEMPTITVPSISYNSSDAGTTAAGSNLKEVKKQTANIIPDIKEFPHAGVYQYEIAEKHSGYAAAAGTALTYSKAVYNMEIHIKNSTNSLEISGIYVNYVKDDDDNPKTGKVDPTPGTGDDLSDWIFVNKFAKNGGTNANNALTISKTVTGALGDKTKQFTFTMNLNTLSALETPGTTYTGTITRANGSLATDTSFELSAASNTFTLADGESLVFDHLPVGTIYTVAETNSDGYSTTVEAMVNGQSTAVSPTNAVIGEHTNRVTFTNTKNNPAPTGILVNNLPFIILILVAVCGFAGYIVLKRRSYKNKP